MHTYPKSEKKDSHVKQLFALFGSACVKVAPKHVDEIDPWKIKSLDRVKAHNGLHMTRIGYLARSGQVRLS